MRRNILRLALLAGVAENTLAPVASANFLTSTSLPAWLTHSRAGNATVFDSTGKLTYAPNNLLTYNQQIVGGVGNWGVGGGATVTWNQGASPVTGANVVSKIVADGSTIDQGVYANAVSVIGRREIFAVWLKGAVGGEEVQIGDASSRYTATLTASWAIYYNPAHAAINNTPVVYAKNNTAMTFFVSDAYLSAVTYETAPRPQDQVVTTSGAYYGPRFDYDPASLQPVGLGIWDTYVQRLYPSKINTQWSTDSTGNMAFSFNDAGTLAPDGTQTATLLTATGADGYVQKTTGVATSASSPKKSSVWLKRKTGTGQIDIADADLAAWHAVTLGSGWTRVEYYKTSAGIQNLGGIRVRTSGDAIWAWDFNVTDGPVLYPTQPATSGPVTVAADVVRLTGTALTALQGAQGAAFVETGEVGQTINAVSLSADPPTKYAVYYHGTTTPWAVANYNGSTALDGATKASLQSAIRAGVRWNASGRAVVASGGTIAGDANTLSLSDGFVQRLYPSKINTQWSTDSTGNMAFSFNDAGTLAPDGTQTATLLTATGADGYVQKTTGVATSASSPKKSSVWLKRKTGTGQIDIADADLAAWHAVTLGSGWTRVEYYKTSAGIQNLGGIRVRTSGDAIWAWDFNVTDGPVLYPTQPATSGPVTVAADVWLGSYTGISNFLNGHVRSVGLYNQSLPDAQFKAKSTEGAPY